MMPPSDASALCSSILGGTTTEYAVATVTSYDYQVQTVSDFYHSTSTVTAASWTEKHMTYHETQLPDVVYST